MNAEQKKCRDSVDAQIKEVSVANYEGNVKSIALVYVDNDNNMRTAITIGPNMGLALVGALNMLAHEVTKLVAGNATPMELK